jgi:hypothetical protein
MTILKLKQIGLDFIRKYLLKYYLRLSRSSGPFEFMLSYAWCLYLRHHGASKEIQAINRITLEDGELKNQEYQLFAYNYTDFGAKCEKCEKKKSNSLFM